MPRDVVGRSVGAVSITSLRAHIDRLFGEAIERPVVGFGRLSHPHLAPIEDRDLERNVEPALAEWLRIGVMSAVCTENLIRVDDALVRPKLAE